jgi:hypothetical protein
LGALERAHFDHWIHWKLTLSKGPIRVDVSVHSPEDGNRSSLRYVVFSSYLGFRTTGKVHKPSDSKNNKDFVERIPDNKEILFKFTNIGSQPIYIHSSYRKPIPYTG